MGIRIHKVLGYGLVDLKHKKGDLVDPRINPKGLLAVDWEEKEERWTLDGYEDWLSDRLVSLKKSTSENDHLGQWIISEYKMELGMIKGMNSKRSKPDVLQHFIHNQEYGLPNVLCVVPAGHLEAWHHYDDPIDYHEETYGKRGQRKRVQVYENGIFPYNCNYCDVRDQRRLDSVYVTFARRHTGRSKAMNQTLTKIAKDLGFKSRLEMAKYAQPQVPYSVQMLCEYAKIFKKKTTINHLVPMLYVYWS